MDQNSVNSGVSFLKIYLLTYKCSRCNHVWEKTSQIKDEVVPCIMGCSNPRPLIFLWRLLKRLISKKELLGWGYLIEVKTLGDYRRFKALFDVKKYKK